MKGSERVIEAMNGLLAAELTAMDQYFIHSRMYADWGFTKLHDRLAHEFEDEKGHAAALIERILFLEGLPNLQDLGKLLPLLGGRGQLDAVDAALARPLNRFEYTPDSSLYQLAAAYGFGISSNHPFIDGNKRVSRLAANIPLFRRQLLHGGQHPAVVFAHQQVRFRVWIGMRETLFLKRRCFEAFFAVAVDEGVSGNGVKQGRA